MMRPERRFVVIGFLVWVALALAMPAQVALGEDSETAVEIPGTGMALDPLSPGFDEEVEQKKPPQVKWPDGTPRLPVFVNNQEISSWFGQDFARPSQGSATIKRVIVTAGGKHENNGAAFVYVAAGGSGRVQIFDPVNLTYLGSFGPGGSNGGPADKWDSLQSIAYARGEVFVLGKLSGRQEIRVFDEQGQPLPRTLFALPEVLGPFEGMDAAFGELWLTRLPAVESADDLVGQQVLIIDAKTGAIKGISTQPLNDKRLSDGARNWWDLSIAPELQGAIVDRRFFARGDLIPGLATPDSPLCLAAFYYACTSTNQRGTDAVPGMSWFLELPSYAEMGTNRPVQEFSIDDRATVIDATLIRQLLGDAITIPHPGHYLTPQRTWVTQQQHQGDPLSVSDLVYNSRDVRIDWWGQLKRSNWLQGRKCVGYVVSEADIFVVGDRGERWFELSQDFRKIELLIDGQVVATSYNPDGSNGDQLCFDTQDFADAPNHSLDEPSHSLVLKSTLETEDGERTLTAENPDLRIDNHEPDQTLEQPPQFIRETVQLNGTTTDMHAGVREWAMEVLPPGADPNTGWQVLPDSTAADPELSQSCSDPESGPTNVVVNCPWATNERDPTGNRRFPDGSYQVQLRGRDLSSDDGVADPVFGTGTTADDGNVERTPQTTYVDNTPPSVSLSGQLQEFAYLGALLNTRIYPLAIDAQDAGSGVVSVDVQVDGVSQDSSQQSCQQGGCSLPRGFNFVGSNYTQGTHTIQVVVRDQVGWTTTAGWRIYLDHALPGDGAAAAQGTSASASTIGSAAGAQSAEELELAAIETGQLMPCTASDQPPNFTPYSVGTEFAGLPSNFVERRCDPPDPGEVASLVPGSYLRANHISYVYGDCVLPETIDSPTCQFPLEIQTWPICERNASSYPLPVQWTGLPELPRVPTELRDVPAALFDSVFRVGESSSVLTEDELDESDGLRIELYAGDATIIIFSTDATIARDAVGALRAEPIDEPLGQPESDPVGELGDALPEPARGAMKGNVQCASSALSTVSASTNQSAAGLGGLPATQP